ncbi:MAG: hypothetical protein JWO68_3512 [Actinomycetia bacterium]|nr:hypothetical protein [Actinomycetes bacterium]
MSHRRISLKERREVKKLSKRPRTEPVAHPFLLPNLREGK